MRSMSELVHGPLAGYVDIEYHVSMYCIGNTPVYILVSEKLTIKKFDQLFDIALNWHEP